MLALETDGRTTKQGSINLDQRLAVGGCGDNTVDP